MPAGECPCYPSWEVVVSKRLKVRWPLRLHPGRPCRWFPRGKCCYYLEVRGVILVLQFVPWKGIAWRATHKAWPWWTTAPPPLWEGEYPEMKKKSAKVGAEGGKHLAALESNILKGLLPLIEHMAIRQYDDGDSREPGWITLKTSGAAWIVQVKDPDACCSFSAVADTIDKALETAALLLSCDEAPWEPDRFLQLHGKKKKG